jgi:ribosomal protein S12 methylthiotransferase
MNSLIREAESLVGRGARELVLVAQDLTRYGKDLNGGESLEKLLRKLSNIAGLETLRLMYCYPESITDGLIKEIAENPKIAKYIDIPFQHADNEILKLMNRRSTRESQKELIKKLRVACPKIKIRSTFILGFPGETEKHFESLLDFLREERLDYAGFFAYSPEPDTPASKLKGRVPFRERRRRKNVAASVQYEVVLKENEKKIGQVLDVLYEDIDYKRGRFSGRIRESAPEIDSKVFFTSHFLLDVGQWYKVEITGVEKGYDLVGKAIEV